MRRRKRCCSCFGWLGRGEDVDHSHCSLGKTISKNGNESEDTCSYYQQGSNKCKAVSRVFGWLGYDRKKHEKDIPAVDKCIAVFRVRFGHDNVNIPHCPFVKYERIGYRPSGSSSPWCGGSVPIKGWVCRKHHITIKVDKTPPPICPLGKDFNYSEFLKAQYPPKERGMA